MTTGLLHIHSLLRYILLAMILVSIFKSFSGWLGKKPYLPGDKKVALFTLISAHLQLVVGLTLYFLNGWHTMIGDMKNPINRFWAVEHMSMMLIGIILITVGYSSSKRGKDDQAKHKRVAIFFLLALLIIFMAIPWPWSAISRQFMPGM